MTPLERITERVHRNGDPNDPSTPSPLLTLDEFFDGNEVVGSIGCNLDPPPTPAEFRTMLERIANEVNAIDVRIEVTLFDDPEWPFSEAVWLFCPEAVANLERHFPEAWAPDEVSEELPDPSAQETISVPSGAHAFRCWWD